ncbi:HEAT repeat domain-containing protein [Streptomyces sp. Y1]|uniref:HEAT repeat domain-containing protein n=1 Tax=Streptomyces sp. Y1 TaxID=3238634 RepID=A0AB39TC97_9ACTN
MSTSQLLAALGDADPAVRRAAEDALVALGPSALPLLLARLLDSDVPAFENAALNVVRRSGRSAFRASLDALREAAPGQAQRRAVRAFTGLGAAALADYTGALGHEDPVVRRAAVSALGEFGKLGEFGELGKFGEEGVAVAAQVVPLLGDPDAEVRRQAVSAFCSWGAGVVPLLRAVRRGGPGAARAGALEALAEIGGEAVLSARDVAALERLVRIKLPDDVPSPLTCCHLSWIAVSTGDQGGVMDLLGLSDPRRVPFAAGVFAADCDGHGGLGADPLAQYRRVFVTPELDGWTLVVGAWCDPADEERAAEVLATCARLSARYGRAQAYWHSYQNDGSAVLVAEGGTVLRRFAFVPGEEVRHLELGAPLPYEQQRRAALGLPPLAAVRPDVDDEEDEGEEDDDWFWELIDLAPGLAGHLSLDPRNVDGRTPARGTGCLALTGYGRESGAPPGALRL